MLPAVVVVQAGARQIPPGEGLHGGSELEVKDGVPARREALEHWRRRESLFARPTVIEGELDERVRRTALVLTDEVPHLDVRQRDLERQLRARGGRGRWG